MARPVGAKTVPVERVPTCELPVVMSNILSQFRGRAHNFYSRHSINEQHGKVSVSSTYSGLASRLSSIIPKFDPASFHDSTPTIVRLVRSRWLVKLQRFMPWKAGADQTGFGAILILPKRNVFLVSHAAHLGSYSHPRLISLNMCR